jgi:hypothetical protein
MVVGSSNRDGGDDRTGLMKFAQLTKQKSTDGLGCIHSCDHVEYHATKAHVFTAPLNNIVSGAIKARMERKRLTSNQLVNRMRTIETFKLSCCAST